MHSDSPHVSSPVVQPDSDIELCLTNPSPKSSPPDSNSPFHAPDDINPFLTSDQHREQHDAGDVRHITVVDKGLKHCISDTNLNKLKQEYKPMHFGDHLETLITRSEEDLTATSTEPSPRHCVAKPAHNVTHQHTDATKELGEDRLSKSLFFVQLDDHSDWVSVGNDYKTSNKSIREVRSTETSPILGRKDRAKFGSKHKLEFLNPSGIKPITSKASTRSPEISGRHNRRGLSRGRDRSKSAAVPAVGRSSKWVSRYRPGVAVPIQGETPRENIMQSELRHREKEFSTPIQLRYIGVELGKGFHQHLPCS